MHSIGAPSSEQQEPHNPMHVCTGPHVSRDSPVFLLVNVRSTGQSPGNGWSHIGEPGSFILFLQAAQQAGHSCKEAV